MHKHRGFTLIELFVVLSIVAILATLAAPSFTRLINSNSITSNVNSFMADLRFARSESIRRGGGVQMCRSDLPEDSTPTCGTGSGPGGNGWVSGWIIFHDLNGNGNRNTGEPIFRVQAATTSVNSILESGGGGGSSTRFKFTPTGRLTALGSSTKLQFGGNPEFDNETQRVVCVSVGGRARVAGNGASACGSSNE